MGRLKTTLTALALGAGAMYLFDPDQGRRRRALLRDQVNSALNNAEEEVQRAREDLRNRGQGIVSTLSEMRNRDEPISDRLLEERARARMGRYVSHPGSVVIRAEQGRLHLTGPILGHEAMRLVPMLRTMRGVKDVVNNLELHAEPGNVPGLQGESQKRVPQSELMQENWSPGVRLLNTAGGGALALSGMRRGGLTGKAMTLLGLGAAVRGVTNRPMTRMMSMGSERYSVDVMKSINVNVPPETVYQYWSNYTNFPLFMEHVKEVRDLGGDRSHWKVAGPAGTEMEWDAVTTRREQDRLIAWKSEPNQQVENAGVVRFEPNAEGGTRVTVRMSYNPPAGVVGHAVASLLGADPKQAMDEDLLRFKSLIEKGKTSAEGREVRREEVRAEATRR